MNIGDFFPVKGYDEIATAQTDIGHIGVYSNNSSHLLVASVFDEAMSDGEGVQGRLEGSFPYWEGDDHMTDDCWQEAYQKALNLMVSLTLRAI